MAAGWVFSGGGKGVVGGGVVWETSEWVWCPNSSVSVGVGLGHGSALGCRLGLGYGEAVSTKQLNAEPSQQHSRSAQPDCNSCCWQQKGSRGEGRGGDLLPEQTIARTKPWCYFLQP